MLFLLCSCKQNNSSLSLLVSTTVVSKENSTCHSNHKTYINIDNKLNSTYKAPKKLISIQGGGVGASATPADHIVNKS